LTDDHAAWISAEAAQLKIPPAQMLRRIIDAYRASVNAGAPRPENGPRQTASTRDARPALASVATALSSHQRAALAEIKARAAQGKRMAVNHHKISSLLDLESRGFVQRTVSPGSLIPEWTLTPAGEALEP
jgi:hypothetical protein